MPRDSSQTRARLLDAAEALVLEKGFAASSIDNILERAGLTKGTFFYHFASKAELALALICRYAELEQQLFDTSMARAERLARDPRQQLLIFVGLFQEAARASAGQMPGCLFASYCYEMQLFDVATLEVVRGGILRWRQGLEAKLRQVAALYPPRLEVDLGSVADGMMTCFEGAYVLSRTLKDARLVEAQLASYRNYLELLFEPAAPRRS
jgi:TetR/AcrR family transcriptional regulator, transcriptional repressor for nem operon